MAQKQIAILGSTGSIGTQTLEIIEEHPDLFRASVLTAHSNWQLLAEQAHKFRPELVAIADETAYVRLKEALAGENIYVMGGQQSISDAAAYEKADTTLTALVGYSGLLPTVAAIKAGKEVALANKETLVAGGRIVTALAARYGVSILPVDSEHSAIFQCLRGENRAMMRKIILTASGGPFRNLTREQLRDVTPAQALNHPNWSMGAKVTIDSASMMNKGFEMIEARWLFDCSPDDIEIMVHPQSIVHSMVEFKDGSVMAQLGMPDMRIPISVAIGYPDRIPSPRPGLPLSRYSHLTFEAPDYARFPLLGLAFDAIREGGSRPCVLNAANEVAVKAFLEKKIRFTAMPSLIEKTLASVPFVADPSLEDLIAINSEARGKACEMVALSSFSS